MMETKRQEKGVFLFAILGHFFDPMSALWQKLPKKRA